MTPPRMGQARLADKIVHNPKFIQYFFEYTQPTTLEFKAGQYVSIKVSEHGERRSYSIVSSPTKTHGFELMVDITPGGMGSTYLESLQFGDEISYLGPLGVFTVTENIQEDALVLVATGSGIAPFMSMLLDQLQQKKDQRDITLYWGLRHEVDLCWQDEFLQLEATFPHFKFHPVISKALPEWNLCRGRVTDCLSIHEQPVKAGYYLCGNAPMIADVSALLLNKGVLKEHIHHEKFY